MGRVKSAGIRAPTSKSRRLCPRRPSKKDGTPCNVALPSHNLLAHTFVPRLDTNRPRGWTNASSPQHDNR